MLPPLLSMAMWGFTARREIFPLQTIFFDLEGWLQACLYKDTNSSGLTAKQAKMSGFLGEGWMKPLERNLLSYWGFL